MKTKTLINLMKVALVIALLAAAGIALWNAVYLPVLLATVSWNG